jgi:hypothetical protein
MAENKDLGFGKKGKQDIKEGRGRDAAADFKKADSPKSVKSYLGEGSKYKHASN